MSHEDEIDYIGEQAHVSEMVLGSQAKLPDWLLETHQRLAGSVYEHIKPIWDRAGSKIKQSDVTEYPHVVKAAVEGMCEGCAVYSLCQPDTIVRPDNRVQTIGNQAGSVFCAIV